jgi:hypothetical protein
LACSIKVDFNQNLCFSRIAANICCTHHTFPLVLICCLYKGFSIEKTLEFNKYQIV